MASSGTYRFLPRTHRHLVGDLASLISAQLLGPGAAAVCGVTLRAQDTRPGDIFAALPGTSTHGAQFASEAVRAGAVAVLTDAAGAELMAGQGLDIAVLVHPFPRSVLGQLAATVYGEPSRHLRVVAVTGTSGKTTTTYLVEAGLRAAGKRVGLIGTVGVRIDGQEMPSALTTPEAPALQELLAEMVQRGVDTVVMEVSSHALALHRVDGTCFAVSAFTNLSRDHLDFHADMEDYFATKARLFRHDSPLRAQCTVICVDDDAGRAMAGLAREAGSGVVTVSSRDEAGADWSCSGQAASGHSGHGGQRFVVNGPDRDTELAIALPGQYNLANCLVAVAILDVLGVPAAIAAPGIATAGVPGRMEAVAAGQPFLAVVDYAHKPGALRAVLESLRSHHSGRLAVVFGAGGNRDRGKRADMGRVAAELADLVVVTDDNPRNEEPEAIRAEIIAGTAGSRAQVIEIGDRRAAIDFAALWARPGDTVLIAGKGHESGQQTGDVTAPFDDRVELRSALEALGSLDD